MDLRLAADARRGRKLRLAITQPVRAAKLAWALATKQKLPFSIAFILTHRCNFRCAYCDVPDAAAYEMTRSEFCLAIDELAEAGMARASFSGGEALLRADAVDIIRHARKRGAITSLNSNGWFFERRLDELADAVDLLMISLDGPEPVHDLVRRKRGSFDRALRAITAAKTRGIAVTTITVVSEQNLNVVDEVLELAQEYGFWAYFQPAYTECFDHSAGLDPVLTQAVFRDLAARLRAAKRRGLPVGASPGFTERLARGPEFGDCARCHAGSHFATLMPDGSFVPCHLTTKGATHPNGRELGFAEAFRRISAPSSGPGCAIAPYQEQDLIFCLDARSIRDALTRLRAR